MDDIKEKINSEIQNGTDYVKKAKDDVIESIRESAKSGANKFTDELIKQMNNAIDNNISDLSD